MNCCFEYTKPSCCGRKPSIQIIKEQLTLWGGLFAILFCIASIVYCRKRDVNLPACKAFKNVLVRLCCGNGVGNNDNIEDGNESIIAINNRNINPKNSTLNYDYDDDDNSYGQEMKSINNYGQFKRKNYSNNNNNVDNTKQMMDNNNHNSHQMNNNVIKHHSSSKSSLWHHHRNQTKINPLPQTFQQQSSSIQMSQV
ncbi:hypothetical protein BLA29_005438 [Euroglyphus maynei]|uniref:Uncharacterized protein n=1 Tax=Euroglyphus maynei TaxID=6958 RepID=A0A1Y3BF69_EURMA|nr:hypothetical protein BLA29_005438 [Euroglyphus maynei]